MFGEWGSFSREFFQGKGGFSMGTVRCLASGLVLFWVWGSVAWGGSRATGAGGESDAELEARARRVHGEAILFDGHNDLPWTLRGMGKSSLEGVDLRAGLPEAHTDIPRLRAGGVKAQFWSVYVPGGQTDPALTVMEQIDLVKRMALAYPDAFGMAYTADDVERIAGEGRIASLIGMEGGAAIQNNLSLLRTFHELGARYMTLTHNETLDWADSATDASRSGGLSAFGERVVREMNRLGMLVDISHVSPETMEGVLRVSRAPVIASHSGARGVTNHMRNVPDSVLAKLRENGGVAMVVFYPGFLSKPHAEEAAAKRLELLAKYPDPADRGKVRAELSAWFKANPTPRGDLSIVADHIDHVVKVAGIDHAGVGSDFDGIETTPEGLEDVSKFPNLTKELLRRGYSEEDVKKVLGGNVLRALRGAERVAREMAAEGAKPDAGAP